MDIKNKKKHHYVMKNYLERWKGIDIDKSKKEGVWVINKANKSNYFCTDLNSIAQINYFYELNMDRQIFGLLIYKYRDYSICSSTLDWMELLISVDDYKKDGLFNYEKLGLINNAVLENEYSRIESLLAKILQPTDEDFHSFIKSLADDGGNLQGLVALFVFQDSPISYFCSKPFCGIL